MQKNHSFAIFVYIVAIVLLANSDLFCQSTDTKPLTGNRQSPVVQDVIPMIKETNAGEEIADEGEQDDLSRLQPPIPRPVSQGELEASIEKGAKHLIESQRADGAWGGPQWTGGVDNDPVPGSFRAFDVAVTAMCLEALMDVTGSEEGPKGEREGLCVLDGTNEQN